MHIVDEASRLAGIETEYWDNWGNRHSPGDEVKSAILQSLFGGESAEIAAERCLRLEEENRQRPIPKTLVVSLPRPQITFRVSPAGIARVRLEHENGRRTTYWLALALLPTDDEGLVWNVPPDIPMGYHKLELTLDGRDPFLTLLILTPERAYLPPEIVAGRKTAGVAVSLYGIRSESNWGCGDAGDLAGLLDWLAKDLHGSFLALNPLHAIDNRQPYNISPYLPNSAFFRNPLYIHIEDVEDVRQCPNVQRFLKAAAPKIAELRNSEYVEYERVWRLKRICLTLAFRRFLKTDHSRNTPRDRRFREYREQTGERLRMFALYCALWDHIHRRRPDVWIWRDWPAAYQRCDSPESRAFAETNERRILFHQYLQWLLDEQFKAAQARAIASGSYIGLYHDLALAVDKWGADVWAYRVQFVHGCRVGSPPDGFAPEGQDWGFPPPNKFRLREEGYSFFIDLIRDNSRHGGALRIDHVMRLSRLYWIPDEMDARKGAYVRDFDDDLVGILALESHRGKFLVVGEDLGTVPPSLRELLERRGILSYKVFYFEKDHTGRFRRPEEYGRQALVASTTHDLPTLAGYWQCRDIEARKAAGLLPDLGSYNAQLAERARDKQRMLDVLRETKLLPEWFPPRQEDVPELTGELHNAIIGFLVSTPSALMVLNQEDLTKELEQQNLPASTWQYPNWRRKMKYTVEELRSLKTPQDFAFMFRNWLARSGRSRD